jgi:hypothetical protein
MLFGKVNGSVRWFFLHTKIFWWHAAPTASHFSRFLAPLEVGKPSTAVHPGPAQADPGAIAFTLRFRENESRDVSQPISHIFGVYIPNHSIRRPWKHATHCQNSKCCELPISHGAVVRTHRTTLSQHAVGQVSALFSIIWALQMHQCISTPNNALLDDNGPLF